ncbi:MAG: penicillin-binding transpeptidase domain-containing protein [Bacteroidia bacterium]
MARYEYLDPAKADSIKQLPLEIDYNNVTTSNGPAPYFRQHTGLLLKQWLKENPGPDGKEYSLYGDGLKIYTTIDSRLQELAEEAVSAHMKQLQASFDKHWQGRELWKKTDNRIVRAVQQSDRYQALKAQGKSEEEIQASFEKKTKMRVWTWDGMVEKEMSPLDSIIHYQSFLHAGFLAMEPKTGYIRAWVGGIEFENFQYDHITSTRQVGSTFKPFVYSAALEEGVEPCEYIENVKTVYAEYKNWAPGNADNKYEGYYSMQGGLTNSVNTISAAIMMKAKPNNVYNFVNNIGFVSDVPSEPSIVLGTAELSLMEMVGAYSAFANHGERSLPVYITRIENSKGEVIVEFPDRKPMTKKVMTQRSADMMNYMLRSVVDSGTARRLRYTYGLNSQIGGKTGTTQDQTDGWFIGITPHLVAGVWVGGEEQNVRFRSLSLGQGANTALPIYGLFMQKVYKDPRYKNTRYAKFPDLDPKLKEELDCPMYSLDDPERNQLFDLIELLKQRQEERKQWREERDSIREEQREERRENRRSKWEEFFKKKKGGL